MKTITVPRSNVARRARQLALGVAASATAFAASAGELADAVTGELTAGKAEMIGIGVGILVLCGVAALINRAKSVAK